MTSVSQVIARTTLEHSKVTFGLMGNGNAYFLDEIIRRGGKFVPVRHEVAAVAAADTYFRVSGRIAVASVTYGAGFTNTLTALAEAALNKTPLVVIIGEAPSTGLRPWDVNQKAIATALGVTTLTVEVDTPGATVHRAFEIAQAERAPVIVSIPYDMVNVEAHHPRELSWSQDLHHAKAIDSAEIQRAVDMLVNAKRPLILAGQGASGAEKEALVLASRLGAATATTAIAKGTFAGFENDLGICGGFASPDSSRLIAEADVVLVLGAGLNQFTMAFGAAFSHAASVIQVDIQAEKTHERVDLHIEATVSNFLHEVLKRTPQNENSRREWIAQANSARPHAPGPEFASDGILDPRALTPALNKILPKNRIIVQDGGHFIGWGPMYLEIPKPSRLHLVGTAFQTIGLGLASAVGANAAAEAEETVILNTGDGGMLMALADLESVIRTSASCIIVVYNDSGYGAELHQYGIKGIHEMPMEIGGVDFVGLSRAVGGEGCLVEKLSDLKPLQSWIDSGARGTFLLDCRISPTVVAPYMHEIQAVAAKGDYNNAARFMESLSQTA